MAIPRYFPFLHGVYDVKAGISALGKDHGNGALDALVFQRDEQFDVYQAAKLDALKHADRHVLRDGLSERTERAIADWVATQLKVEHPARCAGLDEQACTLDELALHVQEDLAVLQLDEQGGNRLTYLHVCMPSGWSPEQKIGKPFDQVHAPVPHIEPINAKQDAIARLMVNATRGAVRFAWTITDDAALNHHPARDRGAPHPTPLRDHPANEPLLRVERQVIRGLPDHAAALFTIRTYLYPFDDLDLPTRSALARAVSGMSAASLAYKNMDRALILERLDQ
ncbi:MAG: heme-dependent oxidative N-demethylase subunit alpha family protein [Phycisphaeraceae bacterium]